MTTITSTRVKPPVFWYFVWRGIISRVEYESNNLSMHRIFILSLLAIVSATFALEPSSVILRATEIRGDSMVLEWSSIEGAKSYKVLYDEESLINPNAPEPILESSVTDKTTLQIQKMMEWTEYYFVVQWLDEKGTQVGKTLPLHASTLRTPIFTLKESRVIDDQNITLTFSRPIDLTKTHIEIANTETKKVRNIQTSLTEDDLRVVKIHLEGKLAPAVWHDLVLKKVTDTDGSEMLPESRKTSSIIFSPLPETTQESEETEVSTTTVWETTQVNTSTWSEGTKEPDVALDTLQQKTAELGIERSEASFPLEATTDELDKTPVSIDKLPQTGLPLYFILVISICLWGVLSYKKKIYL